MQIRQSLIGVVLIAGIGATSCGSDSDGSTTAGATSSSPAESDSEVSIVRSRFGPETLQVAAGSTVAFTNTDPFEHTVTAKDDSPLDFDSEVLSQDSTFEVTFADAGTYAYFCQIHPTMRATIEVR